MFILFPSRQPATQRFPSLALVQREKEVEEFTTTRARRMWWFQNRIKITVWTVAFMVLVPAMIFVVLYIQGLHK